MVEKTQEQTDRELVILVYEEQVKRLERIIDWLITVEQAHGLRTSMSVPPSDEGI